jgi:hypothetical protein
MQPGFQGAAVADPPDPHQTEGAGVVSLYAIQQLLRAQRCDAAALETLGVRFLDLMERFVVAAESLASQASGRGTPETPPAPLEQAPVVPEPPAQPSPPTRSPRIPDEKDPSEDVPQAATLWESGQMIVAYNRADECIEIEVPEAYADAEADLLALITRVVSAFESVHERGMRIRRKADGTLTLPRRASPEVRQLLQHPIASLYFKSAVWEQVKRARDTKRERQRRGTALKSTLERQNCFMKTLLHMPPPLHDKDGFVSMMRFLEAEGFCEAMGKISSTLFSYAFRPLLEDMARKGWIEVKGIKPVKARLTAEGRQVAEVL